MDNVEITIMTINDLEEIKDILENDFDDFWNYNVFKGELENPNSKYIVAKKEGKIVGFAGLWKAVDVMHITNIVTKKTCRKQGIANKMLQELLELTKKEEEINEITLEVNVNNIEAKKLYEKYGFNIVGLRKKYYNNTEDAVIMTKKLK